jgi:pimeloyl-ACP methyl ester carboxylesterase
MTERGFLFGKERNLYGVLTRPDGRPSGEEQPAVILLTVGLQHHVGPLRAWVTLARRLAQRGMVSLRFDMGGIGNSELGTRTGNEVDCAVAEIRAAMDLVQERTGVRRFVLVGLCAGADNAHPAALVDPRVAGMVMVDAYGYRTFGYHLRHYLPRLLKPRHWRRFLRRKIAAPNAYEYVRDFPPRPRAEQELQQLVDRGVQMLFLYTVGVPHYFNHVHQFREMFPLLRPNGRIDVELDPLASHMYEFLADRERMFANITGWLASRNWLTNDPL